MSEIKIPWDSYCKMDLIRKYPKEVALIESLFTAFKKDLENKSGGGITYWATPEDFEFYFNQVTLRGKG